MCQLSRQMIHKYRCQNEENKYLSYINIVNVTLYEISLKKCDRQTDNLCTKK